MPYIASMGIYVISKAAMIKMLRDDFPEANDFGSEVIPGATKKGAKVQAYLYDGYWEDIGTIEAFYNANLGITDKEPKFRYPPLLPPATFANDAEALLARMRDHHSPVPHKRVGNRKYEHAQQT